MQSCWTDEKLCKLVELYSKFRNLWDRKDPCHDNLRIRHNSYSKILKSLSMPTSVSISDVIAKLRDLRIVYVSELRKIEVTAKVGAVYKPEQSWFERLNDFLYDHLDADEKLAEFSSSEKSAPSSEDISTRDCCSDTNSSPESDSDSSRDPCGKCSAKIIGEGFKAPKKSRAFFIRSPTILRSKKMNTRYELPRKINDSSIPVKKVSSRVRNTPATCSEDTTQCTQLDVRITSSDVSIKYRRTENLNGDEKCYKKSLKGPRCSIDAPAYFKNIKITISKSGYTGGSFENELNEKEDKDGGFWEMMSMLDLGVPYALTKLETSDSPNPSCCSLTTSTCLSGGFKEFEDEKEVEKIIEEVEATERRNSKTLSCCSDIKMFKEHEKVRRREDTLLEPCIKETKVVCLGDGTLFDDNLLQLLQDLSIKICPVEGTCASGNCSKEHRASAIENSLSCRTCSLVTRPVKEYETDAAGSEVINDVGSSPSNKETLPHTEENISQEKMNSGTSETPKSEEKTDPFIDSASFAKSDDDDDAENTGNTEGGKNVRSSASPRNDDVKVVMNFGERRSTNARDAILHEAKKELWEAGKLYNSGKYVTRDILDSDAKNDDPFEFDDFGLQVASSLKTMGTQRAKKLKRMIAETLGGGTRTDFF